MIPKLTTDCFFYSSLVSSIVVIVIFFCYKRRKISQGDIVPIITIFISCFGFVYPLQIWYVILDKQNLGVLEDQKISILAGSLATMWVAALAIKQSFKE
jgi:hypothetical protein